MLSYEHGAFTLDMRSLILKANATKVVAVKCLCSVDERICLHSFYKGLNAVLEAKEKHVETISDWKIGEGLDGKSHGVRVGTIVHLFRAGVSDSRLLLALRWADTRMIRYYMRMSALHLSGFGIDRIDFTAR